MRLSICLASRGRPELLVATIKTTLKNIERDDTRLVIALDGDDEESIDACVDLDGSERNILRVSIQRREDTIAGKFNRVLTESPADVYLTMVDYVPHLTPGFDSKILDAAALFPDGIGVVYNHMANLSFPWMNAVTAGLVKWMDNKIYPELFPYWFVDHWLDDIARLIGRIAVADVVQEAEVKPPTQEMREPAFWGTFYDATAPLRRECAHRIINSPMFREPEWRKELLRGHHPLIEERGQIVNNRVRLMPGSQNLDLQDPRYVSVKARAISILRELATGNPKMEASNEHCQTSRAHAV